MKSYRGQVPGTMQREQGWSRS